MSKMRVGVALPVFASPGVALFRTPAMATLDPAAALAYGVQAAALGYDSLWVADHLMLGRDEAILEGWTTLAVLAGATSRARLGMIHLSMFMRPPQVIAKMAATLDHLSGGRYIHFLDVGHQGREHELYGLPWDGDYAERVRDLDEATALTLALWRGEPVTMRGRRFDVRDAVCTPTPLQRPTPPIWFGEILPGMAELCARHGHGWNSAPAPLAVLRERLSTVRAACDAIQRDPATVEFSLETQILIAPDRDALRAELCRLIAIAGDQNHLPPGARDAVHPYARDPEVLAFASGASDDLPARMGDEWIIGTPDDVLARIATYGDEGFAHLLLWFMDAPGTAGLELFARDVLPRLR